MKQLKKKKRNKTDPDVAILLDIDNYVNNPQAEDLDNFIDETIELTKKNLVKIIGD